MWEAIVTYDEMVELSRSALVNPLPGDAWQEMYSFWLFVVRCEGDLVMTLEANPPCTFPEDGKPWVGTVAQFNQRLTMGYTDIAPWALCDRRGCNVEGWAEGKFHYDGNGWCNP